MFEFIKLLLIGSMLSVNSSSGLKLVLFTHNSEWKDSSDMRFNIQLINQSDREKNIFDQVLDDVYNYTPSPLDNLNFVAQRLMRKEYKNFRDISFSNGLWNDFRSDKECMDSVERIRDPYIRLMPRDTLYMDYSFMFGRMYPKGKYRIKVVYKYDFTGSRNTLESNWVYFEVKKDLFRPSPKIALLSERKIFWQKK